jgi:hypothetical protein
MTFRSLHILFCVSVLLILPCAAAAAEPPNGTITAIYFTGIGCSHCAKVDHVLLGEWLTEHPDLVVIEYEVFQKNENMRILTDLNTRYGSGTGVPILFFSPETWLGGDSSILTGTPAVLRELENNRSARAALLLDFPSLDITTLPGSPTIWHKDRILMRTGTGNGEHVKALFQAGNISAGLAAAGFSRVEPLSVPISERERSFLQAAEGNGWRIQWNFDRGDGDTQMAGNEEPADLGSCTTPAALTTGEILMLAAADAVNPCAFAVLSLLLLAVVARDPRDRHSLLMSGLYFSAAVFLSYLVYGIVILMFLKAIAPVAPYRIVLTRIFGAGAVLLGTLHLREYFSLGKSAVTSVPPQTRPLLRRIIVGAGSPRAAILAGGVVTVLLLPCTMGPYIIGCGILSPLDLPAAIPYLLLYNLIFILPMIAITLVIYAGVRQGEDITAWRRLNAGRLHLLAGAVILVMGIALFLGLL